MKRHPISRACVLALVITFVFSLGQAAAAPIFVDWTVPGAPYSIAAQSPDTAWVTLPAQNALARIQVSAQGLADTTLFPVPTPNAEPYQIVAGAGALWFTERLGNNIGRLDPTSGAIQEFPYARAGAQPTGLVVAAGSPTRIWFTARSANMLVRLTITDTVTFRFDEFPLPTLWGDAQPEAVGIDYQGTVWFTAPAAGRLGLFRPNLWPSSSAFYGIGAGVGSKPWGLTVSSDVNGFPWLTERQTHRIGAYMPLTFSDIRWYTPPTPGSDPYDIATFNETVIFAERVGNRLGFLNSRTGAMRELLWPGSAPTAVDFDANGCAWAAGNGVSKVARWCPPYFRYPLYLPLMQKR